MTETAILGVYIRYPAAICTQCANAIPRPNGQLLCDKKKIDCTDRPETPCSYYEVME